MTQLRIKVTPEMVENLNRLGQILGHSSTTQSAQYIVNRYLLVELARVKEALGKNE